MSKGKASVMAKKHPSCRPTGLRKKTSPTEMICLVKGHTWSVPEDATYFSSRGYKFVCGRCKDYVLVKWGEGIPKTNNSRQRGRLVEGNQKGEYPKHILDNSPDSLAFIFSSGDLLDTDRPRQRK